MNVIKGLTGCVLGFAGGLAVIALLMPERLAASASEPVPTASVQSGGSSSFLRVRIAG